MYIHVWILLKKKAKKQTGDTNQCFVLKLPDKNVYMEDHL